MAGKTTKKPVRFGTKVFNSLYEAGKYLKINPSCLRWSAEHNGLYKGTVCEYADKEPQPSLFNEDTVPSILKKKRRIPNRKGVRVVSETKSFKSIKKAAEYLNEKPYVLVHILRTAGQFTKNGETYRAIDPARKLSPYTKTMPKRNVVVKEQPTTQPITVVPETISGKSIARNMLKEQASKYIQSNQFTVAKELLDIIESIKD